MKFPTSITDFQPLADLKAQLHLAIGIFDGVHLGHQAVIEAAVLSARRSQGVSAVLTFDPHPSRLFRPENPTRLLMPIETKVAKLHRIGVDCVICKCFDPEFAAIPAESFLGHLQSQLPALKSIYVGENFEFGKKRAGNVATLVTTGRELGLSVFSADRIKHNGQPISSTRIREALQAGRIEEVNDLLGYHYFSSGSVVAGAQLGRKIGFPTLNVPWSPECLPRFGVYLVRFRAVGSSSWQDGVANYGIKPTVAAADQPPALEIHALNSTQLDTGDALEVKWLHFIRPEQKFASVDDLKAQIAKDCDHARTLLGS